LEYGSHTDICVFAERYLRHLVLHSFPTRRSSDLAMPIVCPTALGTLTSMTAMSTSAMISFQPWSSIPSVTRNPTKLTSRLPVMRSEEHTSELQSPDHLVCRLLLEKKNNYAYMLSK